MANDIKIYTESSGINNVVDPTQITFSKGVVGLESAVNVEIDRAGRIVSRQGKELLVEGSFHSLFEVDGGFLVVKDRVNDSSLMVGKFYGKECVLIGIRGAMTKGAKVSYAKLGDALYYCNGFENGVVR